MTKIKVLVPILISILISSLFAYSLNLRNQNVSLEYKGVFEIFFHNFSIGVLLILLTDIFAWPLIIMNGLYLGLALGNALLMFGLKDTILFTLHVPFEVFGWVLVSTYSTLMRRALFQKNRFSLLKELSKKILFHLVPIYLTAEIIESTIIYIRMR